MTPPRDEDHRPIYTIGHSRHSFERFASLLEHVAVEALVDVRSVPYSRRHPQFNGPSVAAAIRNRGISYGFLGRELGARSDDASCYVNGRVNYSKLARTVAFQSAIERIREGSRSTTIALMCAEKDPLDCHRTILVGRELVRLGAQVVHILADGRIESQDETIRRLIGRLGLRQGELFDVSVALINDAYAMQEERIAYLPSSHRVREVQR